MRIKRLHELDEFLLLGRNQELMLAARGRGPGGLVNGKSAEIRKQLLQIQRFGDIRAAPTRPFAAELGFAQGLFALSLVPNDLVEEAGDRFIEFVPGFTQRFADRLGPCGNRTGQLTKEKLRTLRLIGGRQGEMIQGLGVEDVVAEARG